MSWWVRISTFSFLSLCLSSFKCKIFPELVQIFCNSDGYFLWYLGDRRISPHCLVVNVAFLWHGYVSWVLFRVLNALSFLGRVIIRTIFATTRQFHCFNCAQQTFISRIRHLHSLEICLNNHSIASSITKLFLTYFVKCCHQLAMSWILCCLNNRHNKSPVEPCTSPKNLDV